MARRYRPTSKACRTCPLRGNARFPGMATTGRAQPDAINVGVIILGDDTNRRSQLVNVTGRVLSVPVVEALLGRGVTRSSAHRRPSPVNTQTFRRPIEGRSPQRPRTRSRQDKPLATGISPSYAMIPIGLGHANSSSATDKPARNRHLRLTRSSINRAAT